MFVFALNKLLLLVDSEIDLVLIINDYLGQIRKYENKSPLVYVISNADRSLKECNYVKFLR